MCNDGSCCCPDFLSSEVFALGVAAAANYHYCAQLNFRNTVNTSKLILLYSVCSV